MRVQRATASSQCDYLHFFYSLVDAPALNYQHATPMSPSFILSKHPTHWEFTSVLENSYFGGVSFDSLLIKCQVSLRY